MYNIVGMFRQRNVLQDFFEFNGFRDLRSMFLHLKLHHSTTRFILVACAVLGFFIGSLLGVCHSLMECSNALLNISNALLMKFCTKSFHLTNAMMMVLLDYDCRTIFCYPDGSG